MSLFSLTWGVAQGIGPVAGGFLAGRRGSEDTGGDGWEEEAGAGGRTKRNNR